MPEFQVSRIKQHLFMDSHILDGGRVAGFDPDIEIADAWRRLKTSTLHPEDLKLLQHEYFESRFERMFSTDYRLAHSAAIRSERDWFPERVDQPTNTFGRRW